MSKNGLILLKPTTVDKTGTSATISANGSVSFTACSVLSLNGVFSADYDNYMVVMRVTSSSNYAFHVRLRSSGGDNATTDSYVSQRLLAYSTAVAAQRFTANFAYGTALSTTSNGACWNVYGPYLAQPTALRLLNIRGQDGGEIWEYVNTHNQSVSYDGITFVDSGGSNTGRVAVYGMRKE
jgi:hypothetical protein